MPLSRRSFLAASVTGLAASRRQSLALPTESTADPRGYDPWLEIDVAAIQHNVRAVSRLSGGRPILAVVKNNAYGFGLATAGPILDRQPQVAGLAVVKTEEALSLRRAGVKKPILLMGRCRDEEAETLVRAQVRLAPFSEDALDQLDRVARRTGMRVRVHLYLDTGMGRMGLPVRRAPEWIAELARRRAIQIDGAFTELTEDADFDRDQVGRLKELGDLARSRGVRLGLLHAASSAAVMHQPETHLDMVRPGLALYGGYVSKEAMAKGELRAAYRLRARVVRMERLEAGDGVSYHRRWRATRPTWVAVLPVGHVDGYPSGAVKGAEVLIGERLYRVIGTVSASHTIVEVGDEQMVQVGDEVTLVGPDPPAIHPNTVAERAGYSEYDMFMHLNPTLPRHVIGG